MKKKNEWSCIALCASKTVKEVGEKGTKSEKEKVGAESWLRLDYK